MSNTRRPNQDANNPLEALKVRRGLITGETPSPLANKTTDAAPKKLDPARLAVLIGFGVAPSASNTVSTQKSTPAVNKIDPNKLAPLTNKSVLSPSVASPSPAAPSISNPVNLNQGPPPPPPPPPPSNGKGIKLATRIKTPETQSNQAAGSEAPNASKKPSKPANAPDMSELLKSISGGVHLKKTNSQKSAAKEKTTNNVEAPTLNPILNSLKNSPLLQRASSREQYNNDRNNEKSTSGDDWNESAIDASLKANTSYVYADWSPVENDVVRPKGSNLTIKRLTPEERAKKIAANSTASSSPNFRAALKNNPNKANASTPTPSEAAPNPFGVTLRPVAKRPSVVLEEQSAQPSNKFSDDAPLAAVPPVATDANKENIAPPKAPTVQERAPVMQQQVFTEEEAAVPAPLLEIVKPAKANWLKRNWKWLALIGFNTVLIGAGTAVSIFVPPVGAFIASTATVNLIGLVAPAVAATISYTTALSIGLTVAASAFVAAQAIVGGVVKAISKLLECVNAKKEKLNDIEPQGVSIKGGSTQNIFKGTGPSVEPKEKVSPVVPSNIESTSTSVIEESKDSAPSEAPRP